MALRTRTLCRLGKVGSYIIDPLTELTLPSPDVASTLVGSTFNLVDVWMAGVSVTSCAATSASVG